MHLTDGERNLLEDTLVEMGYGDKAGKLTNIINNEAKIDMEWCEYTSHVMTELEDTYGENVLSGGLFKKLSIHQDHELYPDEVLKKGSPACFIGVRDRINGPSVYYRNAKGVDMPLPLEPSLKIMNHSPDGFEWGYGGSGPAQLAIAILQKACGKEMAMNYYMEFKWDVVAGFSRDHLYWTLTVKAVREWVRETHERFKHLLYPPQ